MQARQYMVPEDPQDDVLRIFQRALLPEPASRRHDYQAERVGKLFDHQRSWNVFMHETIDTVKCNLLLRPGARFKVEKRRGLLISDNFMIARAVLLIVFLDAAA